MSANATGSSQIFVNTFTQNPQSAPAITALDDGGWLVVWESDGNGSVGQDGDWYGVYMQRYDAMGVAVGEETQVNTTTASMQFETVVTMLDGGGWLVTWTSALQDDPNLYGVYQQRYDATGGTMGTETLVNSFTTGSQRTSSVAALADGGWVVTWESSGQDGGSENVYQQLYDSDGKRVGGETQVNATQTNDQGSPVVTALADGGWLVAWTSTGQDGFSDGVYQRRYDADGSSSGSDIRVNQTTTESQWDAAVTGLADGGWLVTWTSLQNHTDNDVYQQRYDADGTAIGSEQRVNAYVTSTQYQASTAALADGGWVVTYTSYEGVDADIYQQRYNADGVAVGGAAVVNLHITGQQVSSSVTALANGGWTVSWTGTGPEDDNGIYQRHFAADVIGTALADTLSGTGWGEMLIGNAGNDTLDGKGGADILLGGFGNDTYVVDNKADDVQERAGQGSDTIKASVTFSLAGDSIEKLVLTGSADRNGTGNQLDNQLTGNSGANKLYGSQGADRLLGSVGNDLLEGGAGIDRFVFRSGDDKDKITDFDAKGSDHEVIDLSALAAVTSFNDLKTNHMQASGGDVIIDAGGGDRLTLVAVKLGDLDAGDFLI